MQVPNIGTVFGVGQMRDELLNLTWPCSWRCVGVCVCVCGLRMPLTATLQNELEIVGVWASRAMPVLIVEVVSLNFCDELSFVL